MEIEAQGATPRIEPVPPPPDARLEAARTALSAYVERGALHLRAIARLERWAGGIRLLAGGTVALALLRAAAPALDTRTLAILAGLSWATSLYLSSRVAAERLAGVTVAGALGRVHPTLADELRSFIELDFAARSGRMPRGDAFLLLLGERLVAGIAAAPIEIALPARRARRGLLRSVGIAVLGLALVSIVAPRLLPDLVAALRRGPEPAPVVQAPPIVGDLELVLHPPAYTGLPPRAIPSSGGDLRALPGTEVTLRARSLVGAVRRAELRLVQEGAAPALTPAEVTRPAADGGPAIAASFVVKTAGTYQLILWRWTGRLEEPSAHRIDLDPDVAPRVELRSPGDPLELDAPRPVELSYEVEDDFGVADVALVYQIGTATPVRMPLTPEQPTPRRARGRFLWELGVLEKEGPLPAGVRIEYWIEAHDNDAVAGAQVGRSSRLAVILRGKHEASQVDRVHLEELLDGTLNALADRHDHDGTEAQRHASLQALAEKYGEVARLEPDGRGPPKATASLRKLATEVARRLQALLVDEGRDPHVVADKIIAELEHDALALDDLRGRRRLEQMARIGEEMKQTRDELKRLMEELKTATSEAHKAELKREIERKLVELEAKMAELRRAAADAEGEVPDEFLNRDAIAKQDMKRGVEDLRQMLANGDVDKAMKELERMSRSLDQLTDSMDKDMKRFRGDRDPEAEKQMAELQNDLADLAKEEHEIEQEARALKSKAVDEAAQRASLKELRERLRQKLDALEQHATEQARDDRGVDNEKVDQLKARAQAIGRALEANDLEDAQAMARDARRAAAELAELTRSLQQESEAMQQARVGDGPSAAMKRSTKRMAESHQLAQQIEAELDRIQTERRSRLNDADRKRLGELMNRQQSAQQRADELARRMSSDAPGMKSVPDGARQSIDSAKQSMNEAVRQLGKPAAGPGADAAKRAADALDGAGRKLSESQRGDSGEGDNDGRAVRNDQPVKIPGAEDSAAPRAFREELLEAMKRGAPRRFEEQVRQYYEELVR